MRLILFRHGPAGQRDASIWANDSLRPLTGKGARRTEAAARGLRRQSTRWDLVLTSPYRRARETADIVARVLSCDRLEEGSELEPDGDRAALFRRLQGEADSARIVLVGHEPSLGEILGELCAGPGAYLPLRKAGAACVEFDADVAPGSGRLRWLLQPRQLRQLGRGKDDAC